MMEVQLEFWFCKAIVCCGDGLQKHFVAGPEWPCFLPVLSTEEEEFFFHIFKNVKKNGPTWKNPDKSCHPADRKCY